MRKFLKTLFLLAGLIPLQCAAWVVPEETLQYEVHYRWGLINANAGVATVKSEQLPGDSKFKATLTGRSVNLLGHYYEAGDMLVGTMMSDTFQPVYNERITRESGEFTIEKVVYSHGGPTAAGESVKTLPDGTEVRTRVSHYAGGLTLDLLAVFYYIRQIDYQQMHPGQSVTVNIFAGNTPEVLTVTYQGQETFDFRGTPREVFRIDMSFQGAGGGSGTSDRMSALISTSDSRIPLVVDGRLKFGHLHCLLLDAE